MHRDPDSRLYGTGLRMGGISNDINTHLYHPQFLLRSPTDTALSALEVFKLENTSIVPGQILIWVPRTRPERPHPPEPLEPRPGGRILRRVDFIRENEVVLFFTLTVSPCLQPAWRESYLVM